MSIRLFILENRLWIDAFTHIFISLRFSISLNCIPRAHPSTEYGELFFVHNSSELITLSSCVRARESNATAWVRASPVHCSLLFDFFVGWNAYVYGWNLRIEDKLKIKMIMFLRSAEGSTSQVPRSYANLVSIKLYYQITEARSGSEREEITECILSGVCVHTVSCVNAFACSLVFRLNVSICNHMLLIMHACIGTLAFQINLPISRLLMQSNSLGTFRMQCIPYYFFYMICRMRKWYHWTHLWRRAHAQQLWSIWMHTYLLFVLCANEGKMCWRIEWQLTYIYKRIWFSFQTSYELIKWRWLLRLWLPLPLLPFLFAMRFWVAMNDAVGKKATYIFSCQIWRSRLVISLRWCPVCGYVLHRVEPGTNIY